MKPTYLTYRTIVACCKVCGTEVDLLVHDAFEAFIQLLEDAC